MSVRQHIVEYDMKRFTWCKEDRVFVAEASDFGALRDGGFKVEQIYDDACDSGFKMVGGRQPVIFYEAHQEIRDGELKWIDYKPITESERKVPACRGIVVRIFND